ncbi:hypothetical protein SAMN04487898_11434 [Pedobacter sp. ok626]|nr:hypothetical protein SAMN04487898_11434 [Pedobacter sp. ok626]
MGLKKKSLHHKKYDIGSFFFSILVLLRFKYFLKYYFFRIIIHEFATARSTSPEGLFRVS